MDPGQLWLPNCIYLQRGFDKQYGFGHHFVSLEQKNITEMVPKGEIRHVVGKRLCTQMLGCLPMVTALGGTLS